MVLRSVALVSLLALAPGVAVAQSEPAVPAPAAEPTAATPAQPAAPAVDEAREARINEIDQRSRILERKLELADEELAKRIKETPVLVASEKGFSITSPDKAFQVRIRGLVQADGRFYFDDDVLKQKDTFLIRKARPYLDATLGGIADFRIMADFTSTSQPIQDAYADFRPWTFFKLRAGKFKSPVGLERLQGDPSVKFVERSLTSSVAPNRDVGVQLHGDILGGTVSYAIGVFDGAPDGGSVDVDNNYAKDFAGRLFLQPFKNDPYSILSGLGIGVGGSTGNQKGTTAAPNLPSYLTAGQQTFFQYLTDSKDASNNVFARKRRSRIAPGLYYAAGPFFFLTEWVIAQHTVEKKAVRKELVNQAYVVQASYVLTGDTNSYEGVTVKEPVDVEKGTWGAPELSVRYNELTVDDETFPIYADPNTAAQRARAWSVNLFWNWSRNLAWLFNYEQTHFKGGAAANGNRKTEKALFGRAQVSF